MSEIIRLERLVDYAPDLAAIVNIPENKVPTRGYIFNEGLQEIYGGLDNAVKSFRDRMAEIPDDNLLYILGFVFGHIPTKSRDFFAYLFTQSSNPLLTRTESVLIIKNGTQQPWTPRFKEDFGIILGKEAIHRRTSSFEDYLKNPPKFNGLFRMVNSTSHNL